MATKMALIHNISFSHNLTHTSPPSSSSSKHPTSSSSSMDHDFDFSVSCDISAEESSLADELFSNGRLLPLSCITNRSNSTPSSNTTQSPSPPLRIIEKPEHVKDSKAPSFWSSISRSKSVGTTSDASKSIFDSICPRSKSTGSCLNQNGTQSLKNKEKPKKKGPGSSQSNGGDNNYYLKYSGSSKSSSSSKGVKINPVINVPAHFAPRGGGGSGRSSKTGYDSGLITYLLCNCGYKSSTEMVL